MDIPALLKELEDYGLRPEEIAVRTGAGINSIYRWRRGNGEPLLVYARKIENLVKRERAKCRINQPARS